LENSRAIHWDRTTHHPGGVEALEVLLEELLASEGRARTRRPADMDRLRATMTAVVLDLFVSAAAVPDRFLAYSRNVNDYRPSRYSNPAVALTPVVAVADFLQAAGYAEGALGYQGRDPGGKVVGRRSRLRATAKLVEHLQSHGLTARDVSFEPTAEIIRLKDKDSPGGSSQLVGYEDDDATAAMRDRLTAINALIASVRVDLEDAEVPVDEDADEPGEDEERPDAADRSAVRLHRVFSNGTFTHGGRFYGGWWMSLQRHRRPGLLIDGEVTVEMDYRALHPRLCYLLSGHDWPMDADPYTLPNAHHLPRKLAKAAFTRLLNVAGDAIPKAPKGTARRVWLDALASVRQHHAAVADWFGGGRGMELQRIDSDMAAAILGSLAYRGIPCLPVHDSFIVPASRERALGEAMCMAFRGQIERYGGLKAWPAISGWSSAEVERRVRSSLDIPVPPCMGEQEQGCPNGT
jgi:hypothetical protein